MTRSDREGSATQRAWIIASVIYIPVLVIKRPDTNSYLWLCTLYIDRFDCVLLRSRFTPLKSVGEGHSEMGESQILPPA